MDTKKRTLEYDGNISLPEECYVIEQDTTGQWIIRHIKIRTLDISPDGSAVIVDIEDKIHRPFECYLKEKYAREDIKEILEKDMKKQIRNIRVKF
jgi:hypothetical protein